MPRHIKIEGVQKITGAEPWDNQYVAAYVPVATEGELLDFANALRAIGGAEILPALLPGQPSNAATCLIARNLNFECTVGPDGEFDDGFERWTMTVNYEALAERIAKTLNTPGYDERRVFLPKHIGFAAKAFDQALAFTELSYVNTDLI